MSNIWKEPYPGNFNTLLRKAKKTASDIKKKLNDPKCPKLSQLYNKTPQAVWRNVNVFNVRNYSPNTKLKEENKEDNEFRGLYGFG